MLMNPTILRCNHPNAQSAQKWTAAGLPVFPCCPETKKPRVSGWRSADHDGSEWLLQWNNRPDSMPGLDCGSAGLVVIDCDNRENFNGEHEFRNLCDRLGVNLTDVPNARTPSGGRHFYFKQLSGRPIRNSAGDVARGVDVRGEGGFIVVPGARRSDGGEYRPDWPTSLDEFILAVARGKLPEFPELLIRHIVQIASGRIVAFPHAPQLSTVEPFTANDELSAGIKLRWELAEACARVAAAPVDTRNHALNREAYTAGMRAADGSVDPSTVQQALSAAAQRAGVSDEEISQTLGRALLRGKINAKLSALGPTTTGSTRSALSPTAVNIGGAGWERTGAGSLKRGLKNAMLAVQSLGIEARRNTFSDKIYLRNSPGASALPEDHVGPLTDNTLSLVRKMALDTFALDPGKDYLVDAIKALAEEARFDPVQEWLDGLTWDGKRRLRDWLPRITGAPATPLFKAAGVRLLAAMVARARFAGSKFDLCLVLEGEQGCGKSSLVRVLASALGDEYFVDAPGLIGMDNKARAELLSGKWLVEIAELSGMAKSETEGVKAFLTQRSDHYRPPYAAVAVDRPRRCIFVATTNAASYLPDATGNRRFLPVPCAKIDLDALMEDRDQLFAEADVILRRMTREAQKAGRTRQGRPLPYEIAAKLALPPSLWRDAADLTDRRRVVDPVEEALPKIVSELEQTSKHRLTDGRTFISSADLLARLRQAIGSPVRNNGLAGWMQNLGWIGGKYRPPGADQIRGYMRQPQTS